MEEGGQGKEVIGMPHHRADMGIVQKNCRRKQLPTYIQATNARPRIRFEMTKTPENDGRLASGSVPGRSNFVKCCSARPRETPYTPSRTS